MSPDQELEKMQFAKARFTPIGLPEQRGGAQHS